MPNGCDCRGCCDFDINRNGTRERVNIREPSCHTVTRTTTPNVEGGPCTPGGDGGVGSCTGTGQRCIRDGDGVTWFCAPCTPCRFANEEMPPIANCTVNPCMTGERCVGDPPPPPPPDGGVPDASMPPPDGGTTPSCPTGTRPCLQHSDCGSLGSTYFCITGCCQNLG